ncbi:hypothetical protein ABIA38_008317 [Embleya sp. AB8]
MWGRESGSYGAGVGGSVVGVFGQEVQDEAVQVGGDVGAVA